MSQRYEAIQGRGASSRHRAGGADRRPSKTQALIQHITAQIESGELKPGDKLPSSAQLRSLHQVSGMVVREATLVLKAKGLVVGVPGVGVFVAER